MSGPSTACRQPPIMQKKDMCAQKNSWQRMFPAGSPPLRDMPVTKWKERYSVVQKPLSGKGPKEAWRPRPWAGEKSGISGREGRRQFVPVRAGRKKKIKSFCQKKQEWMFRLRD